ncbi:MAG: lysylphosphatidylglycerol synthase transmembrane domain-containing protein [Thermoanaerobaculia bacterium]
MKPPIRNRDDPPARRRRLIRRVLQVTIALAGVLLAWRMVEALSWEELTRRIREAQGVLLAAATVLLILRWYFWQARWGSSLVRCGHATTLLRRGTALMASVFVNHVAVRFFGGVLRGRYLAGGLARDFPRQYGIVLFDQLMHQLATTVFTWLAVAYVFFQLGRNTLGVTALVTLAILAAAVPFVIGREGWVRRLAARIGESTRRSERLHGLVQQGSEIPRIFSKLLASKPHVGRAAVLTWVYISANVLAQWLVFRSIEADVPLLTVAAVLGIGSVIGTLTGVPGGLGPMEAALLGGYDLLGIDPLEAAAGTLLYRGLHYILVLGLGLPSLLLVELRLESTRAPQRDSELEA